MTGTHLCQQRHDPVGSGTVGQQDSSPGGVNSNRAGLHQPIPQSGLDAERNDGVVRNQVNPWDKRAVTHQSSPVGDHKASSLPAPRVHQQHNPQHSEPGHPGADTTRRVSGQRPYREQQQRQSHDNQHGRHPQKHEAGRRHFRVEHHFTRTQQLSDVIRDSRFTVHRRSRTKGRLSRRWGRGSVIRLRTCPGLRPGHRHHVLNHVLNHILNHILNHAVGDILPTRIEHIFENSRRDRCGNDKREPTLTAGLPPHPLGCDLRKMPTSRTLHVDRIRHLRHALPLTPELSPPSFTRMIPARCSECNQRLSTTDGPPRRR